MGRAFHTVGATRSMNAGCVGGTGGPELGKGRRLGERIAETHSFLLENSPRESWKEIIIFLLFLAHLCLHSQAGSGSPIRALLVWPRCQDQVQRRLVYLWSWLALSCVSASISGTTPKSQCPWSPPCCIPNPSNSQLLPTAQPLPSYLLPRSPAGPSVSPLPTNLPSCQLSSQITVLIFSSLYPLFKSLQGLSTLTSQPAHWSSSPPTPTLRSRPRPPPTVPPFPEQANASLQKARQQRFQALPATHSTRLCLCTRAMCKQGAVLIQ